MPFARGGAWPALTAQPTAYLYPNDTDEQDRQHFEHVILQHLMGGRLYFAPWTPERPPRKILDIGTGTGIVSISAFVASTAAAGFPRPCPSDDCLLGACSGLSKWASSFPRPRSLVPTCRRFSPPMSPRMLSSTSKIRKSAVFCWGRGVDVRAFGHGRGRGHSSIRRRETAHATDNGPGCNAIIR